MIMWSIGSIFILSALHPICAQSGTFFTLSHYIKNLLILFRPKMFVFFTELTQLINFGLETFFPDLSNHTAEKVINIFHYRDPK